MEDFLFALLLSFLAGLATTIGSLIAFFIKKPSPRFISFIMGFSAGVMILISFVELLQQSIVSIGYFFGLTFFFLGMLIMLVIDVVVSHEYEFEDSIEMLMNGNGTCKPHIHHGHLGHGRRRQHRQYHQEITESSGGSKISLLKTSIFIFFGVFIHNFPEGMATFIGTITEVHLGLLLVVAITLHNIPEGIAVAIPIYICTQSKKKAFKWSFISGMSEPLGALITWIILYPFINEFLLSSMLGIVGGIMVYISLDELLPTSRSLGKEHVSILGIIAGMGVMAVSLLFF